MEPAQHSATSLIIFSTAPCHTPQGSIFHNEVWHRDFYLEYWNYQYGGVIPYLTNKMNKVKYNKTDLKTHFLLGTNSYMFRHLSVILREFMKNKGP